MAVIVFSGGHTLRVPTDREGVRNALATEAGLIPQAWRPMLSGNATVFVNPLSVAYIADDDDFDSIGRE